LGIGLGAFSLQQKAFCRNSLAFKYSLVLSFLSLSHLLADFEPFISSASFIFSLTIPQQTQHSSPHSHSPASRTLKYAQAAKYLS